MGALQESAIKKKLIKGQNRSLNDIKRWNAYSHPHNNSVLGSESQLF